MRPFGVGSRVRSQVFRLSLSVSLATNAKYEDATTSMSSASPPQRRDPPASQAGRSRLPARRRRRPELRAASRTWNGGTAGLATEGVVPEHHPEDVARIPFADREPHECAWPTGDPRDRWPAFGVCGARTVEGRPYCASHVDRSISSALPRLKEPRPF